MKQIIPPALRKSRRERKNVAHLDPDTERVTVTFSAPIALPLALDRRLPQINEKRAAHGLKPVTRSFMYSRALLKYDPELEAIYNDIVESMKTDDSHVDVK